MSVERHHAKLIKANREYRCPAEWFHDPTIRRGEQYIRVTHYPPYDDPEKRFDMSAYHPDCYDEWILP